MMGRKIIHKENNMKKDKMTIHDLTIRGKKILMRCRF